MNYGSPSAIWVEAWVRGTRSKPRSCCGKRYASKTRQQPSCCQTFTRTAMEFRRVAIRHAFCCWLPPSAGPRRQLNSCAACNLAAADKRCRKATNLKTPLAAGSSRFCTIERFSRLSLNGETSQFIVETDCGDFRPDRDSECCAPSFPEPQAWAGTSCRRASYQRASSTRFQRPSLS